MIETKGTIENWLLNGVGGIQGDFGAKGISTSRVVSRDESIVTTKSGSRYRLGDPHPYMTGEVVKRYWKAGNGYEAIDKFISGESDASG